MLAPTIQRSDALRGCKVNSQPPLAWSRLGRSIKMVLVSSQYVTEEISHEGGYRGKCI